MVHFYINMEGTGLQNNFSQDEIKKAKKIVKDFYDNRCNNLNKLNWAIDVFNCFCPNGTFEQLKQWTKED